MNILLINLPRYKSISAVREERCEFLTKIRVDTPTTLLTIASLLRRDGHKIDFIDANALNLSYEDISKRISNKKIDCVVFSFNSMILEYDLKICDLTKKVNPSCITIGFSWFSRYHAKEILTEFNNLDIQIVGPCLSIIENLMKYIDKNESLDNVGGIAYRDKNNIIRISNKIDSEIKFDDLPMPAYDLLPSFEPYYLINPLISPCALVYAGKGCPFECTYCNVSKTKYNGKSSDNIIKELKMLKKMGVKYIWFFDEIFTINRKRVVEICEKILEETIRIKWFCDSRVELVDKNLLKLMRKAGCIGISYGVESGSQKILDAMNKGNTVEQAKKALIWTRKAHIPIHLNLILGFTGEDEETIEETKSFVRTTLPERLSVGIITAKPGTEFTKLAIENKWVDESKNWKQHLMEGGLELKNYEPFNLNLKSEKMKIKKMLNYNPKWWIAVINTLIWNRELILPSIAVHVFKHMNGNANRRKRN